VGRSARPAWQYPLAKASLKTSEADGIEQNRNSSRAAARPFPQQLSSRYPRQFGPRLDAFLASNELCGGSGSIADGAGGGERSEGRRRIERILIQLGKEQMRTVNVNPLTEMWVTAFSKWEEAAI
jgi:hypothetical protein